MRLYIGNKNYSSWSLRPWLLMTQAGIAFQEVRLRLNFDGGSDFKRVIASVSPAGRVPVLVHDGLAVWDTLAIAEYLAELHPALTLWPADRAERARARSLCAEMHAGFGSLRKHCPMNIEASLPDVGARLWAERAELREDVARIEQMWAEQLSASGGPFLFGAFGIADAFYAPVCSRLRTYALPVSAEASAYLDRIHTLASMQRWFEQARAEHDFLDFDEPYRQPPA